MEYKHQLTPINIMKKIDFALIIKTIIMYSIVLLMLIPFFWMISTSLKLPNMVFDFPVKWIPQPIVFDGYKSIWINKLLDVPFYNFYFNSIKVTGLALVGTYFACSMSAYAYAKINFKGRDTIFMLKIAAMMVPAQVTMIPTFIIFRKLGLMDSHAALWLPLFTGSTFGVFLLRQFFMGVPSELCEAAHIDGAGHPKIYWSIVMPLARPAIASLLMFTFVGIWNDYEGPLIYLRSIKLYTVPIALQVLANDEISINYSGLMAATVCAVLPIIIILSIGQKYFIQGISLTGIKG